MPDSTSDQEQQKKPQPTSEPAKPQPAPLAPQPELDGLSPSLSLGPGLGSPDGFEKRLDDARLRQGANRQQRVQTLTAMQRQFGNREVQRFMVQRRASGDLPAVQREGKGDKDKEDAGTITIDEKGVTNAVYNKPSFSTKDEKATPSDPPKDVKPEADFVDVTATAVCTYTATVSIGLPSVPGGLTACQSKRVKDAIDNQLAPHERQHQTAMKTYDGTYEETFTLAHILRSTITAALTAKAKQIADTQQATRQAAAQKASDALDQPPFIVNVDLNCEDEKKPDKKDAGDTGAQPQMTGGDTGQPDAGAQAPPADNT